MKNKIVLEISIWKRNPCEVVIDIFSRKNWVRAQKTLTAEETAKNLDEIISSMPYLPSRFASDRGSEFSETHPAIFRILIDKFGMLVFKLGGDHKASMAERFIRTLKTRIERHFTENNTLRWVDVLQKLSEAINNSVNRSIGIPPNTVNEKNRAKIFQKLYGQLKVPPICRYAVGDKVRIPMSKNIFQKGYEANWSKEIYEITHVFNDGSVCYYKLQTSEGDPVERKYYTEELNLVARNNVPDVE